MLIMPDTSPRGDEVPNDDAYDLGQGAGFYLNATQAPRRQHFRMYDYLNEELPTLIASNFKVSDRQAIMGHSMGGHGALVLALRNPHRFASVSAFAPIVNPAAVPWGVKAFSAYLGEDREQWRQYDSCLLMAASPAQLPILIDQGDSDQFLADQLQPEQLEAVAQQANWPLTLRIQPGYDHSYFLSPLLWKITCASMRSICWHKKRALLLVRARSALQGGHGRPFTFSEVVIHRRSSGGHLRYSRNHRG